MGRNAHHARLPTTTKNDAAHDHDGGQDLQDVVGTAVEEALQLVHVVVEHRQQAARGAVLEPAQLEPLGVVVGLHPQLALQVLSEVSPRDLEEVLEQRLPHPDQCSDERQDQDLVAGVGDAEHRGDDRVLALHDDVDGRTDQERWREVEELVGDRECRRLDDPAAEPPAWRHRRTIGWAGSGSVPGGRCSPSSTARAVEGVLLATRVLHDGPPTLRVQRRPSAVSGPSPRDARGCPAAPRRAGGSRGTRHPGG